MVRRKHQIRDTDGSSSFIRRLATEKIFTDSWVAPVARNRWVSRMPLFDVREHPCLTSAKTARHLAGAEFTSTSGPLESPSVASNRSYPGVASERDLKNDEWKMRTSTYDLLIGLGLGFDSTFETGDLSIVEVS